MEGRAGISYQLQLGFLDILSGSTAASVSLPALTLFDINVIKKRFIYYNKY